MGDIVNNQMIARDARKLSGGAGRPPHKLSQLAEGPWALTRDKKHTADLQAGKGANSSKDLTDEGRDGDYVPFGGGIGAGLDPKEHDLS